MRSGRRRWPSRRCGRGRRPLPAHSGRDSAGDHSERRQSVRGGPTLYWSNLTAVDAISIARENTIDGDVASAGLISIAGNVEVTGVVDPNEPTVIAEALPILSFSAGGADISVAAGPTVPLAPGSYGAVLVQTGGTLNLTSGEYFFSGFTMQSGSTLEVEIPTGPVAVNVETMVLLQANAAVSLPRGGDDSRYLRINSLTDIFVQDGVSVQGQLIAPNGQVVLEGGSLLTGTACAAFISADPGSAAVRPEDPLP